jgi:hypothetical protein
VIFFFALFTLFFLGLFSKSFRKSLSFPVRKYPTEHLLKKSGPLILYKEYSDSSDTILGVTEEMMPFKYHLLLRLLLSKNSQRISKSLMDGYSQSKTPVVSDDKTLGKKKSS